MDYELIRSSRRTLALEITREGRVLLRAPHQATQEQIDSFFRSRRAWLETHLERVEAQAQEYGHSRERELSYLVVHSVLHLLGYDHMDEGPMKRQMRRQEEIIMAQLLLKR